MTNQTRYKRRVRNLLIHKAMQREFVFVMVALLLVTILGVSFVIHNTIREAALGGGLRYGKMSPYEVLSDVTLDLIIRVAAILSATLFVICIFGIFFLFRVAGPVYRFRQVFMKINDGEIPQTIQLREGDFFTETADEINQLLKQLQLDRNQKQAVSKKLDQIMATNPSAEVTKAVKEAKKALEEEPREG